MSCPSNILHHIQSELQEREWELFDNTEEPPQGDRQAWREAWMAWREQQIERVLANTAYLRVWIESTCIGCFDCEIMCPEIFSVGKHRSHIRKDISIKSEQHGPHLDPCIIEDCYDNLELARQACPVEAISVCISDPDFPEPMPNDFVTDR